MWVVARVGHAQHRQDVCSHPQKRERGFVTLRRKDTSLTRGGPAREASQEILSGRLDVSRRRLQSQDSPRHSLLPEFQLLL